jgi:hypothetical protein
LSAERIFRTRNEAKIKRRNHVDIPALKQLYQSDRVVRLILDLIAQRQRNQGETKVERVQHLLLCDGKDVSRGDIIEAFRSLEKLGVGQFVTGRRGWSSRFVWSVGMVSVGRAAAGERSDVEQIPEETGHEEENDSTLSHTYNLRADVAVTIDLPTDLTRNEAERLASFIRTLPIDEES